MQENGIDPLRSAEGRAIIQNIINTTDKAGINLRKTNAALGEEYLKNRAKMIADGTYNEDYEKFMLQRLGLGDFNSFDSSRGSWTRTTPSNYQDLAQSTQGWVKDLEPEDMGLDPTGKYRIFGIPEDKLKAAIEPNIPGYLASDIGAYQYDLAKNNYKQKVTLILLLNKCKTDCVRIYTMSQIENALKSGKKIHMQLLRLEQMSRLELLDLLLLPTIIMIR